MFRNCRKIVRHGSSGKDHIAIEERGIAMWPPCLASNLEGQRPTSPPLHVLEVNAGDLRALIQDEITLFIAKPEARFGPER